MNFRVDLLISAKKPGGRILIGIALICRSALGGLISFDFFRSFFISLKGVS